MGEVQAPATHAIALAAASELGAAAQSSIDADYRASRLAARRAIWALVGGNADVVVERRPGRAPFASVGDKQTVELSLAHRDGLAVAIAAYPGCHIGIDLDRLESVAPAHARYFLTAREQRAARLLTPTLLWVVKEAVWKAMALRDDVPLGVLELDLDHHSCVRGVSLRGEWRPARVTLMAPWPGYLAAAVWVGEVHS